MRESVMKKKRQEILDRHPYKIWEGKDGYWRTYLPDAERGRSLKKRKTKEDIEDLTIAYYEEQEHNLTIKELFEKWSEEKREYQEICAGTYDRYLNDYKRFIQGTDFEKLKIGTLTEDDLYSFIKETIRDKKLSAKAYAGMRTIIRGILKYAKRMKLTQISCDTFFKDLDVAKNAFTRKTKDRSKEIFTDAEVSMITHYVHEKPTIRNLAILLAFQTGVRAGELATLKRQDFDTECHTLHIQRTEITYKNPQTNKSVNEVRNFPKTENSDRYVIITDKAIRTYRQILALNPFGEFLFEENGKRLREMAFNRRLYRICDDLKIPRRSMHKIRKTYGTTLIDNYTDESLILEQMGHKQISTTRQFYYFCNRDTAEKRRQIEQAITC